MMDASSTLRSIIRRTSGDEGYRFWTAQATSQTSRGWLLEDCPEATTLYCGSIEDEGIGTLEV